MRTQAAFVAELFQVATVWNCHHQPLNIARCSVYNRTLNKLLR